MSGATTAAIVTAAAAVGSAAYTARQSKKAQEQGQAAAEKAAAKSQVQESRDPIQQFRRGPRRRAQGFDTLGALMPASAGAGSGLLGQ